MPSHSQVKGSRPEWGPGWELGWGRWEQRHLEHWGLESTNAPGPGQQNEVGRSQRLREE